jgi:CBS domain-containing protein
MTKLAEVMTRDPVVLPSDAGLDEAARAMKDADIGDVLVTADGALCGIVTDRDLVVRGLADGKSNLGEVCSRGLYTLSPDADVEEAVTVMREAAIRRIAVVDGNRAVGVVSLGDLALEEDPGSALADISAAQPNN